MPLPKIDLPTYVIKLPSNGKEVTIRPFLVKEEKLLLIAFVISNKEFSLTSFTVFDLL